MMGPATIPAPLKAAEKSIENLIHFSRSNSLTVLDVCLAYAKSISWASGIVLGAASLSQLREILESSAFLPSGWANAISKLPPEIVDPRRWSL